MEPIELRQARSFLGEYDNDNRKVNKLELGLNSLYGIIEGDYDLKCIEVAKNILNSYKNKIIKEAKELLSDYTRTSLSEVIHLKKRIVIFKEAGFDYDGELESLRKQLAKIILKLEGSFTTKELHEIMKILE
jgi:hypothetical protein